MHTTNIETKFVGPLFVKRMNFLDNSCDLDVSFTAPLATYESPLFNSVSRGAKVSRLCQSLVTTVVNDCMTRSVIFETPAASMAYDILAKLNSDIIMLQQNVVNKISQYTTLQSIKGHIVGNLLYLRFSFDVSHASGHNMVTVGADALAAYLAKENPTIKYISVSGNFCTDKKVSSINSILGRGKYVVAEGLITGEICQSVLRTSPAEIVELNVKKNLIGSIINGGVASANAHFANMLLAFYLATGQDGANIVEGSQGVTFAEVRGDDLYFSVTLPNIIVGVVGNGKHLPEIKQRLEMLGCIEHQNASQKLAQIVASVVWAGELSLMSALTNKNELVNSHVLLERKAKL